MDAFRCCPPQCLKPRVVGLAVHRYVLSDEHLPENRQIVDRGESQKMAVSLWDNGQSVFQRADGPAELIAARRSRPVFRRSFPSASVLQTSAISTRSLASGISSRASPSPR